MKVRSFLAPAMLVLHSWTSLMPVEKGKKLPLQCRLDVKGGKRQQCRWSGYLLFCVLFLQFSSQVENWVERWLLDLFHLAFTLHFRPSPALLPVFLRLPLRLHLLLQFFLLHPPELFFLPFPPLFQLFSLLQEYHQLCKPLLLIALARGSGKSAAASSWSQSGCGGLCRTALFPLLAYMTQIDREGVRSSPSAGDGLARLWEKSGSKGSP